MDHVQQSGGLKSSPEGTHQSLVFQFLLYAPSPGGFGRPCRSLFGCCLLVPSGCGTNPLPFPAPQLDLHGFLFGAVPQVQVVDFVWAVHSKVES